MNQKPITDNPIWKVSLKDGNNPIELNKSSMLKAREHYARYHHIPLDDVIGYDYLRIKPVGVI